MNTCKYYTLAFLSNPPGTKSTDQKFYCTFNPESGEEHKLKGGDGLDWTLRQGALEKKGAPCEEGNITSCPYKEHSVIRKEAIDIANKFVQDTERERTALEKAFPGILE